MNDYLLQSKSFIFLLSSSDFFSDCTTPFQVSVVTDATQDAIAATIASSNKGKKNLSSPFWKSNFNVNLDLQSMYIFSIL